MELNEFITSVITNIVDGVVTAQEKCNDSGCVINPSGVSMTDRGMLFTGGSDGREFIQSIEFEVGLNKSNQEGSKSGIGVLLGNINIGKTGSNDEFISSITKIKFVIPIKLPSFQK